VALCGDESFCHDFLYPASRESKKNSTPDVSRNEDFEVDGGKQLRY
jgi:hypothetical protein